MKMAEEATVQYLGLSHIGIYVYSNWLLPSGKIVRIDLDDKEYRKKIKLLNAGRIEKWEAKE